MDDVSNLSCNHCDKTFFDENLLSLHTISEHKMTKQIKQGFKCESCEKLFTKISYLKRHKKTVHEEIKNVVLAIGLSLQNQIYKAMLNHFTKKL